MVDEKLVSEAIRPVFAGGGADSPMVLGEPVIPESFQWRGQTYPVLRVLASGRGLGPCTHGSGEMYVRRHWYRFESTDGMVLRVYFERRPRSGAKSAKRWWLYSVTPAPGDARAAALPSRVLDPGG